MSDYRHRIRMNCDISCDIIAYRRNIFREGEAVAQFEAELARIVAEETAGLRAERDAARAEIERSRVRPEVCVAVILIDDGRILLLRRADHRSFPGMWCLPGGHIEDGETPEECCRRELAEETGIDCDRFSFARVTHAGNLVGLVYCGNAWRGEAVNAEPEGHSDVGWFPCDRMPTPLMPILLQLVADGFTDVRTSVG